VRERDREIVTADQIRFAGRRAVTIPQDLCDRAVASVTLAHRGRHRRAVLAGRNQCVGHAWHPSKVESRRRVAPGVRHSRGERASRRSRVGHRREGQNAQNVPCSTSETVLAR